MPSSGRKGMVEKRGGDWDLSQDIRRRVGWGVEEGHMTKKSGG